MLELVHGSDHELTEQELVELIQSASEKEKGGKVDGEPQQEGLMLETPADIVRTWSSFKSTMYDQYRAFWEFASCWNVISGSL